MNDQRAPELVPATFTSRDDAEAAVRELNALGFGPDDLGVAVPEALLAAPREEIVDDTTAAGLAEGAAMGAPIGSIAGIVLWVLNIGVLGAFGVGGLLLGAVQGALWGAVMGSYAGLLRAAQREEDQPTWSGIPLSHEDILLVVRPGERVREVHDAITRHGGRCLCFLHPSAQAPSATSA